MKRTLLSALAVLGVGATANAQFSVYDNDGKVLFTTEETPAYVDFTYHKPLNGTANGHEWVDMGLSVKWSSVNIGASSPEQYGNYYAWGETTTKENYSFSTYTAESANFIGDNKITLESDDDAAAANWQGGWVMPTNDDWIELYNNTTQSWTDDYNGTGAKGCILTSAIEGYTEVSIFLPAAGVRYGSSLYNEGSVGGCWSSSLDEDCSGYGRHVYFNSGDYGANKSLCFYGLSVRPVCPAQGVTNGHDAVDLGLPSGKMWASCNVGANAPEERGDYFAWGETQTKSDYSWSTYKHMQSGKSDYQFINKYQISDCDFSGIWYNGGKYTNDGGKTVLDSSDDVATQNWGEEWRMPTIAEWQELCDNTTRTWTSDYNGTGVSGYILTSTVEGHTEASIFLPAAGCRSGSSLYNEGSRGFYWSSLLGEGLSSFGRGVDFNSGSFGTGGGSRHIGQPVRPVCPDAD